MKRIILLVMLWHFCIDGSTGLSSQVAQAQLQNATPLPIAPLQQALPVQALHKLVLGYLDGWQATGQTFSMDRVSDIQFSPDGNYIACCSSNKIVLLHLQNNNTYEVYQELTREWLKDDSLSHIQFSEDGKYVIIASTISRVIAIWELRDNRYIFLQDLTDIDVIVSSISFSLNGEFLAFSSKNEIKSEVLVYRKNNKKFEILKILIDEELYLLSSDATYLIAKSQDNELKRYALYGQDFLKIKLISDGISIDQIGDCLLFSFNGKHIIALKEQLKIFYCDDNQQYTEVQKINDRSVTLSPDESYIATNSDDFINEECKNKHRKTQWHIWKLNNNIYEFIQTIEDISRGQFKSRTIFSPDNKYLVFTGYSTEKSMRIWELKNNKYQKIPTFRYDHDIQEISFSPNGLYMACALNDGQKSLIKLYGNQAKGAPVDDSKQAIKSPPVGKSNCIIL